jgi:leader peptidase (prepilin peptidase)/N-methyltransferase
MLFVAIFVLGALVGSFLNVCIHRLPTGESVVFPASHCPQCQSAIQPYDNIPILSYLLLRGRCRKCGAPIPIRYPLVESLAGLGAVASVYALGLTAHALLAFAFLCGLIVTTFIDYDYQIIPDAISLPGIGVGFVAAIVLGSPTWIASLAGILLGGGVLWGVAEVYHRLTGREGMGGGDIKLLAMIGAFLGWQAVPVTLMIASLAGTAVGVALIVVQRGDRRTAIPFGPFLAVGAICALFWGDALIAWYLGAAQAA